MGATEDEDEFEGEDESRAAEVLDEILAYPPVNRAELRARLGDVDRGDLLERVEEELDDSADIDERSVLLEVLEEIAPARYAELMPDPSAMAPAGRGAPRMPAAIPDELADEMRAMVASVVENPELAESIAEVCASLPAPLHAGFVELVERARKPTGVPARILYAPFLKLLPEGEARGRVAGLAAPVGSGPHPLRRVVEGFGWVGSCDGSGGSVLFAGLRNGDGSHTVVNVVVRAHGEVRDSFVLARQSKKAVERLIERFKPGGGGFDFARAPLGLVARIVADAVERGRALGVTPSPGVAHAIELLGDVPPEPPRAEAARGAPPEPGEAARLFSNRGEYDSWFFDLGDFEAAGAASPHDVEDEAESIRRWVEKSAVALDRPPVRRRLAAMMRHMALYHELRREPREARVLRALVRDEAESLRGHELFLAMVARSFGIAREQPRRLFAPSEACDYGARHALKAGFFSEVTAPRGRDLLALDLAAACAELLQACIDYFLETESRPPTERIPGLAHRIAVRVAAIAADPAARTAIRLQPQVAAALAEGDGALPAELARRIARRLAEPLADYFLEVCAECPVACLGRPDEDVAAAFFAPEHPFLPPSDAALDDEEYDDGEDDFRVRERPA